MVSTLGTFTEPRHGAEFILSEASGMRSRENVILEAGQLISAGQVLAKRTSTGDYAAFNADGSDGLNAAVAISIYAAGAVSADVEISIIARDAEVNGNLLVWYDEADGPTTSERSTAVTALLTPGIVVRY